MLTIKKGELNQGNQLCQDALAFTDMLADIYFVNRRLDELPQYMSDMVSWIGTGKGEISKNIEEAKRALMLELQSCLKIRL